MLISTMRGYFALTKISLRGRFSHFALWECCRCGRESIDVAQTAAFTESPWLGMALHLLILFHPLIMDHYSIHSVGALPC